MSVNVEDRTESKVEYLEVARQISKRTAQMVANGPKKYMSTYGDHLMRCSLQMFTHADIANSIYVTCQADFEQRRKHLIEARGMCFSIESTAKLYTDLITAAGTAARDKAYGRLADIARLPMDDRLLGLTAYLINCFDGDSGLGLGSEVSQVSAVFYVSPVDHIAKDRMGVHCYGRYMDDAYAILPTKEQADEFMQAIRDKSRYLGLSFNEKVTKVKLLKHGFHYLKKRVGITDTGKIVIRPMRDNVVRERRRIRHNIKAVLAGEMKPETERQSWESWRSHCLKLNAHRTVIETEAYRKRLLEDAGLS